MRKIWVGILLAVILCGGGLGGKSAVAFPKTSAKGDWKKLLDDWKRSGPALSELARRMDPDSIEILGEHWRSANHPIVALELLVAIAGRAQGGGPHWQRAMPYLTEAVEAFIDNPQNARAAVGAELVLEATDRAGQLLPVELLAKVVAVPLPAAAPAQRTRAAALRALGGIGEARAVEVLIGALETGIAAQPVVVFSAAAEGLAEQRSAKAIPALLATLYLVPPARAACSRALVAIGPAARVAIIEVLRGKDATITALAEKQGFTNDCRGVSTPRRNCRAPGLVVARAAELLGDMRASEAVTDLVKVLDRLPVVVGYRANQAPGGTSHEAVFAALVKIGDARAARPLLEYARDDGHRLRLRGLAFVAYSQLTRDSSGVPSIAILASDYDITLELAAAEGYANLVTEQAGLAALEKLGDRYAAHMDKWAAPAAKAKAELADFAARVKSNGEAGDKRVAERHQERLLSDASWSQNQLNEYQFAAARVAMLKVRAALGIRCGADPVCYAEAIGVDNASTARAFIELGKLGDAARGVQDKLLAHVGSRRAAVRLGALQALARVAERPCAACVERLNQVLAGDAGDAGLAALSHETRLVRSYLEGGAK